MEVESEVGRLFLRAQGYRVALQCAGATLCLSGTDFPWQLGEYAKLDGLGAIFRHDDRGPAPRISYGAIRTLHTGPRQQAYVMLRWIPRK